jgi:carbonic anhydrase
MSGIDRLVRWNHANAGNAAASDLEAAPATKVTIVTCMDARISTPLMLGVLPGEVHVLRNAGGIVTDDTIRSVLVSQVALGTEEVMVIGHTRCGMEGLVDNEFRAQVSEERGHHPVFEIGGFDRLEDRVSRSVRDLRRNNLIQGDVRGFVFDVDTGYVEEIEVD